MNNKHLFDEKQRFSLRKLTVGLASVLVGLTLFGTAQTANSQTVHAATITHEKNGDDVIDEEPAMDPSTGDLKHETVGVIYEAQGQDQTIHYHTSDGQPAKDKDGNTIPDGHVTGKTDDMNKDVPMPNGYVPKTPGTDDKTNLNNPDPNTGKVPPKTVTVEHGQHTTAPGETHNVNDPITPNPNDPKDAKVPGNTYQQAITDKDVKKDLTRTVTINKPKADGNTTIEDGQQHIDLDPETKTSTVSYHRTTTVDDVTGQITGHGAWQLVDPSKNQFDGVTVPQFDGYTAHITDGAGHPLSNIDPENAPTANDSVISYTDPKIVVNYTANSQSVNYVFTDGASGNVGSGTVHGVTGQTVTSKTALASVIKQLTDKGYDMSKVTIDPYTFKAHNGDITIDLANDHGIIKGVDPNPGGQDPNRPGDATKIPEGLKDTDGHLVTLEDTRKEITRSITANEPTGDNENARSAKDLSQHGVVTRTFDYDKVTKTITHWNAWRAASWDAVTVPEHAGYTPTITDGEGGSFTSIDAMTTSDPFYKDPMIQVNYTANEHQISIEYVDNTTGKILKTDHMSGKTDQTVPITPHIPDGWELVSGQSVPSKVTLGADGASATVIKVQPQERSVAIKFVDDQSYERQVGQAITLTGRDGETVDLHLTVPDKYQLADGQQLPTTYTFTKGSGDLRIYLAHQVVQREATVDVKLALVTVVDVNGEFSFAVTQNHWKQLDDAIKDSKDLNNDKVLPSVKVGTLTGHVNYDLVDNKVVSFADDWTSLNLGGQTYQMPDGTEVVNGVSIEPEDSWGKSLKEQFLKYYPDADPDYVNRVWHGYLSVNKTNEIVASGPTGDHLQNGLAGNESNTLAKATGDQAATAVTTANKTIDSNWLTDNFNTFKFSEQNGRLQSSADLNVAGVYIPYVEKTATRTINVTTPDGKTTTVKQTAALAKQVDFADDAHPAWTTGEWASYEVPTIPGYTASQSQIAKTAVTGTTEDQTVNITYTADPQTSTVVYQTEDGTPVHTTTVNGKTGQIVKVSNEVPVGWHVVNGTVPSEITFGPNGTPKTVVTIAHSHVTVTPDAPKTTSDKLPDNPDKNYSTGVGENDLNKTVTRTIKVTTPDGQNKTIAQTAKLTRTADVDEVTGNVTYGDWTTQTVPAVDVPQVPGYTAAVSGATLQDGKIPGDTLRDGYTDPKIEVTYTAHDSTQTIHYVDENGHELLTTDNKDQNGDVIKDSAVTVKTDEVGNVQVPKGWKLVDDHDQTTKVAYDDDGIIPVKNVKITHATIEVTPDKPHAKGDPIDSQVPTGAKYGTGLTNDDLNDVAYREIHFKLPASTNAEDYAKRLKDSGLTSAHVEAGTNNVIVRQEVAYKRTAIVDAVTGEVKGYNPAGVKNQGWVPSGDKLVDAVIKSGSAVFNKVLIPQIAGYTVHTENAGVTTMKLVNGSHAAVSRLFVSFMAIPAPKDGNSTGAVNKEQVKPDDTKPGDTKPGTTPVKDLTKSDQKKVADDTQPGKGDETKPGKSDETKPGKGDDTKPGKTDDTKPGKSDETKPGKADGTKPGKSDETKPGKSDDTKPGQVDDTKPGQVDDTKPGKGDDTESGKIDGAKPGKLDDAKSGETDDTKLGKSDDTKLGKSDGAKSGKSDGTKLGKKAHVSPTRGNNSGANKKNSSKITNTASGVQADKLNSKTHVGNANVEANRTSHTAEAAVVNNDTKSLPQTGESQNKLGIIGAVFASLAGMLGLAGTKKKRKND